MAGTARTAAELNAEIVTMLASAQTPPITAVQLRQVLSDMVASDVGPIAGVTASPNLVLAGPATGTAAANVGYRALVAADLPVIPSGGGIWTNVQSFGALGNGVTDDTVACQAAFAAVTAAGGGCVYFPKGQYPISGDLTPCSNLRVTGDGRGASVLMIPVGNTTKNAIIRYIADASVPANVISNISVDNLTFQGQWLNQQSQGGDGALIVIRPCANLQVTNCEFIYSRTLSFQVNLSDNVSVTNCWFRWGVRDFCAIWDTPNVRVIGNFFEGNDDDGISINHESGTTAPVRSKTVIANNIIISTGGIRTQAAKEVNIIGNVLFRCFANPINIGGRKVANSDQSDMHSVNISNNIILDVIDRNYVAFGTPGAGYQQRVGIRVFAARPSTGGLPAVPGENIVGTGAVEDPYNYFYNVTGPSDTGPWRPNDTVIIKNNIIKRTLPAVAAYSDWGYGQCFSANGFRNNAVTDQVLQATGMDLRPPYKHLVVDGNEVMPGGQYGIIFNVDTLVPAAVDGLLSNVVIKNNRFSDVSAAGISWGLGSVTTGVTSQDITIEDNLFDCDVNMRSTARTTSFSPPLWVTATVYTAGQYVRNSSNVSYICDNAGALSSVQPTHTSGTVTGADGIAWTWIVSSATVTAINGTWSAVGAPTALSLPYCAGAVIRNNTFKNTNQVLVNDGVGNNQQIFNNYIVCDPAATLFSTSNVGVGELPGIGDGEQWWITPQCCNPASALYEESLGSNYKNNTAMPATGKWIVGTFVSARGGGGRPLSGYTLGWIRLTAGAANVAGIDWAQIGGLYEEGCAPYPNGLRLRMSGGTTPSIEAWGTSTNVSVFTRPKGTGVNAFQINPTTWAAGQAIVYGNRRTNAASVSYRCSNVGGTTTAGNEPVHTSGTVTGGDGIAWTWIVSAALVTALQVDNQKSNVFGEFGLVRIDDATSTATNKMFFGAGSPLNVVTAPIGSVYFQSDGGAGTTFWVKEAAVDATGWVGK